MSKQIQWGILGTANIAAKVGQAIQKANNANLVAIASRSVAKAKHWAETYRLPKYYDSYQQLLLDTEIEAVYIPLPPSLHAEWTIRTAEVGKHILCEKPLSADYGQAMDMVDACRANNVQLMDGVMWVHHDRTRLMEQIIQSGDLGELRRVTSAFTFHWDQFPTDNIRVRRELAGGSLGDLGYYCIRAILWAFGDLPEQVWASARYQNEVDFNVSVMMRFSGNRVASFDCGFDTVLRKWFEIAGTSGSIVCDDFTVPPDEQAGFRVRDAGGSSTPYIINNFQQEVEMIRRFSQQVIEMKSSVQGGSTSSQVRTDWTDQAIDTMRVCQAVTDSIHRSAAVDL